MHKSEFSDRRLVEVTLSHKLVTGYHQTLRREIHQQDDFAIHIRLSEGMRLVCWVAREGGN